MTAVASPLETPVNGTKEGNDLECQLAMLLPFTNGASSYRSTIAELDGLNDMQQLLGCRARH